MLNVLFDGTLVASPVSGVDKNGRAFTSAQIRVVAKGGDPFLASVIAYNRPAAKALAALGIGEPVSVAGRASLGRFGGDAGLSVTAGRVLSLADAWANA